MSKFIAAVVLSAVMVSAMAATARASDIVNPKVTTDRSVDTSSAESIVADIVKPGMTDQEKALAVYHWFQRVIFYHRYRAPDHRNILRQINSYGYTLCGSQAAVFTHVLRAAGLRARIVTTRPDKVKGMPGWDHTFTEVFYDDQWHVLDTAAGLAVYRRGKPRVLANLADIKADPSIVLEAHEEGRAEPSYLAGPWIAPFSYEYVVNWMNEYPQLIRKHIKAMKTDLYWSALSNPFSSPAAYYAAAAKNWKSLGEGAHGAKYESNVLDVTLKPGEVYTRNWDNVGKWLKGPSLKSIPPYHLFSVNDPNDTVNFPYWEPYKQQVEIMGKLITSYRAYANGTLQWAPRIDKGELEAHASRLENVVLVDGTLQPEEAGKPALIELDVKLPYALVEVSLEAAFVKGDKDDVARVVVQREGDREYEIVRATGKGEKFLTGAFSSEDKAYYGYKLRIEMTAAQEPGSVKLKDLKLISIMQLNMFSLPALVPGDNKVTVEVDNPAALSQAPLKVTYAWAEGPFWSQDRVHTETVNASPATFSINVAGPKHPRMKYLRIEALRGK